MTGISAQMQERAKVSAGGVTKGNRFNIPGHPPKTQNEFSDVGSIPVEDQLTLRALGEDGFSSVHFWGGTWGQKTDLESEIQHCARDAIIF
jgi:hypothetical protein